MQKLSLIQDFRKLEEILGKEPSDLLLKILDQREVMLLDQLATKEDLHELKVEFAHLEKRVEARMAGIEAKIGGMAWKMAGLLILQAGVIVAMIKSI